MALVNAIVRAEWLAVSAGGVLGYLALGGHPLLLLPLLLAPDLSIGGYLAGPRIGSLSYNAVHNLVVAVVAIAIGWFLPVAWLALVGTVLVAHVGMDRTLGYGLKLPSGFRETHLGRIGRP